MLLDEEYRDTQVMEMLSHTSSTSVMLSKKKWWFRMIYLKVVIKVIMLM